MKTKYGVIGQSSRGYDRRWEDHKFGPEVKYFGLIDHVGDGQGNWNDFPGNAYGVNYCRAESFYRAFANVEFASPCIVDVGEFPADRYTDDGEPITDQRINMAAAFRGSNIQILPHGFSRHLINNLNSCFENCSHLRAWTPQEMVAAGLAGVTDPEAPRIMRSNGLAEAAFLFNLRPETMRRMFAGCTAYSGHGINAINWDGLTREDSASGFAEGCRFEPAFLHGIIGRLHWQGVHQKKVRTLKGVHLGHGHLVGEAAVQVRQLADVGIEVIVEP